MVWLTCFEKTVLARVLDYTEMKHGLVLSSRQQWGRVQCSSYGHARWVSCCMARSTNSRAAQPMGRRKWIMTRPCFFAGAGATRQPPPAVPPRIIMMLRRHRQPHRWSLKLALSDRRRQPAPRSWAASALALVAGRLQRQRKPVSNSSRPARALMRAARSSRQLTASRRPAKVSCGERRRPRGARRSVSLTMFAGCFRQTA